MPSKELFKKYGFDKLDKVEYSRGDDPVEVSYPAPEKAFRIIHQSFQHSIEEYYFWITTHIREDWGLHETIKINDVFTASEQSTFWGASNQRLQIQQGQVSQYLGTIAQMVKALFQLVHEIRILKEKLDNYRQAEKGDHSADILLKGYWVDLKDGGANNPTSVYGLAARVGFSILPDLFFSAPVLKKSEDVDKYIKKLSEDFNRKVCEVVGRKLKAYMLWRDNTYKELSSREKFTVKYLRQQYDTIKLYMSWVKPYLYNVKRLRMNQERNKGADIIGAFEGSVIEIEVLMHRRSTPTHNAVILATFEHRVRPHMEFRTADYQHKGPVHVGRTEITLRGYSWTPEQIENYRLMKEEENLELLSDIDESLKETMNALGDDLKEYLKEAGEKFPEDIKKEEEDKKKAAAAEAKFKKSQSAAEPFVEIFKGFKEIFGAIIPLGDMFKKKSGGPDDFAKSKNKKKAAGEMGFKLWQTYKNFKASHGMVKW